VPCNIDNTVTESLWVYTANNCWIGHSSNGGQSEDKRAQNSTTKVFMCMFVSAQ